MCPAAQVEIGESDMASDSEDDDSDDDDEGEESDEEEQEPQQGMGARCCVLPGHCLQRG